MGKLIVFLLFLAAFFLVWSSLRRMQQRRQNPSGARQPAKVTLMVPCRVCGAQMDRNLAGADADGYLCERHRTATQGPQ